MDETTELRCEEEPEGDEAIRLLDEYLAELQAGRAPDRARLLASDPGLSSMLDCLDALEHLAPPPAPPGIGSPSGSSVDAPTIDSAERAPSDGSPERFEWSGALVTDFGRYELQGEIGRGGMGVVYKARQKDLERTVAIKMIQARHLASDPQVKRFYAEAKAAGKLQHQNIVRIHEVGQVHGQHYFAMEYVAGESLAEVVRQSLPDPQTAAECVAVVARAVAYLHEQGIVHRDLKPSNILLDDAGRPYVTDFGLAKLLGAGDNADNGTIAGTPSYMAPEQAAGQNDQVGPLSDVYSLGAILYELLAGRPPFRALTALDTLVMVLESEPATPREIRAQVPPELEQICLRCLEKNPDDRYPSAVALAEDLERYLRSDAIDVRPSGWWPLFRRWARREPALVSRLVGIVICIAISQLKHMIAPGEVSNAQHLSVLTPMFVWIVASIVFQQMLNREAWAELGRFLWAGADAILLTSVLYFTGVPPGPLMIGYPLMIAASGLWFQESLVWFMTVSSFLGYLALALALPPGSVAFHHHVVFLVFLLVMGMVVAYQVRRVRALTSYFARRR
jgi:serine/threonine protein kinase